MIKPSGLLSGGGPNASVPRFGWGDVGPRWPSPAKLNLFLHIVSRRDDGYHLLQTVFQLLEYGDELTFSRRSDHRLSLTVTPHCEVLSGADNLVLRAAELLKMMAKDKQDALPGVDIHLYKKLPLGAGLGGGSSNAATTLVALNHLWQLNFNVDELAAAGLALGADVPVFVRSRSAWAEGVGDQLQPVDLPERWFAVVNPGVHVATAALFGHPQLTRDCTPITIRGFKRGEPTRNVFEALVCKLQPDVSRALDRLRALADLSGGRQPRMTGTGSSVFLECDSQSEAQKVLSTVSSGLQGCDGFVARGIEHSELLHYI